MNALADPNDPLFEIERRIARRADELTRLFGFNRSRVLEHWRRAEREVWGEEHDSSPEPKAAREQAGAAAEKT